MQPWLTHTHPRLHRNSRHIKKQLTAGVYKKVEPLIHEGQGCVDVVSEVAALRFSPALFIFRIGVVWPTLVMRTRVTVCLESRGNAVQPCRRISAQPHRPLHSHCLLRLLLDCKSQALLTHLCCLSLRLMAITSVCFFSEGEENCKNQMLFWKQAKWKHWQLTESWQPPARGITTVDLSHKCSKGDYIGFERNVDGRVVAVCQCLY